MLFVDRAAIVICTFILASSVSCHKARLGAASVVTMADVGTAKQLISGFYQLEGNSWRWTARDFSVGLGPPPGSASKGAKLLVRLHIPNPQFEQLGPMTLHASIGGHALDPQVFSEFGNYTYARDIPPELLDTNMVRVNFSLDKCAPPIGPGGRELGIVVGSIGLITE
jgi:hypothetical protein